MAIEAWLPLGFALAKGVINAGPQFAGEDWQILASREGTRVLVAKPSLFDRWVSSGLVQCESFSALRFGDMDLHMLVSGRDSILAPVSDCRSPNTKSEAVTFATALRTTRQCDTTSPLQDALYTEELCRLLPTYSITSQVSDDVVLGYWLTGGAVVSVTSFRRLAKMMSWLGTDSLRDVIRAAELRASDGGAAVLEAPCVEEQESEDARLDEKGANDRGVDVVPSRRIAGVNHPGTRRLHGSSGQVARGRHRVKHSTEES